MIVKYSGALLIAPCPTVLVTSRFNNIDNVLTVAWTGVASSHPEYVNISINKKRYSYDLILLSKRFCINIPNEDLLPYVDYCGSNSGKMVDKFKNCQLTKKIIKDYILIEQCRMSVLCDVEHVIDLGSHTLFVAKVAEKYTNLEKGENINEALKPIAYFRPNYHRIDSSVLGYYGYTKSE